MVISLVGSNHWLGDSVVLLVIARPCLITYVDIEWTFELFRRFVDSLALFLVHALMRLIYILRLLLAWEKFVPLFLLSDGDKFRFAALGLLSLPDWVSRRIAHIEDILGFLTRVVEVKGVWLLFVETQGILLLSGVLRKILHILHGGLRGSRR